MIIFESLLTTFEVSVIFWCSWSSGENWLESKTKPPKLSLTKLSLSKSVTLSGLNSAGCSSSARMHKWTRHKGRSHGQGSRVRNNNRTVCPRYLLQLYCKDITWVFKSNYLCIYSFYSFNSFVKLILLIALCFTILYIYNFLALLFELVTDVYKQSNL